MTILRVFIAAVFTISSSNLWAADVESDRSIPNEYETVGGHSLGLANAGVAATGGISAVRMNPGMIPMEPEYQVSGGYNWPTQGREFYQIGVIDAKSSKVAAGFLYSGFADDYQRNTAATDFNAKDAPLSRRAVLALGQSFKTISLGINAAFIEAYQQKLATGTFEKIHGTTLGIGVAGLITPQLRYGLSAENMGNRKVIEVAPRTFRAGVAYIFSGDSFTAHFDLRQRDRVKKQEEIVPLSGDVAVAKNDPGEPSREEKENKNFRSPERMAIASCSAKVYDMVRLLAGYGQSIAGPDRKTLAAGIAVVSEGMSLSYTASRPYMTSEVSQQAINLSMAVSL